MGASRSNAMSDVSDGRMIPLLPSTPMPTTPVDIAAEVDRVVSRMPAGSETLTVALNDPQRHTRSREVLAAIRETAAAAGRRPALSLVVACGTHRFDQARRVAFERELLCEVDLPVQSITWHDCDDPDLVPVGPAGSWRVQPAILRADGLVVAIGSVEPHYFAGLTGAHKTVTIGCAGRRSIETNHAGATAAASVPFALAGNPVFEGVAGMLGALQVRREVLAVNLLQVGSDIRGVAAGEPLETLARLAPEARTAFCRTLTRPADALVLEVAGPLGESFYQADKALKNAEQAVRDCGTLVLVARCTEGMGQDHFVSLLRRAGTYAQAVHVVESEGYRLGDHKALRLRRLTDPSQRGVRVVVVSDGLDTEACGVLGLERAASVSAALAGGGIHPVRDAVYRVPDAGNTVVLLERQTD